MPMPKNLETSVENVRVETIVRNLDLEVLNRAHNDIHNRIGWKQDSYDEEPYPANDDDYQRCVLAAELLDVIERMTPRTVTPADVKFFVGVSDEDADDLAEIANTDSHEGAEWLPWYKMAMSRLVQCCGMLHGLLNAPQSERLEKQDKVMQEAGRMFYHHLLLCGIGPLRDQDVIRRCEEAAAVAMDDFINKPIGISAERDALRERCAELEAKLLK